jgi:sarcosine oxidase
LSSTTEVRTVVVGLGAIGSATAYSLSQAGAGEVVGLEQFEFGHRRGASHDHSRLIRLAYHTPEYVRLALDAYEAWRMLERASGRRLLYVTGAVDFFEQNAALGFDAYASSMSAAGVTAREIDAAGLAVRWPQFAAPDAARILVHEEGGFIASERACATMRELAQEQGAVLRDRERVESISRSDTGYRLTTDRGLYHCETLILASGAWLNDLLDPLGYHLPLIVTQEQVSYFRAQRIDEFHPDRFPVWTWHAAHTYYGFPAFGEVAVKAAEDLAGRETSAQQRSFTPDPVIVERLTEKIHELLPRLHEPVIGKTCLYTMAPDRDFVIGPMAEDQGLLVAVGDGHGFKFAPVLGQMLAESARGKAADHPVFSARRKALGASSPTRPSPL